MKHNTKLYIANSIMIVGMLPYIAVFTYFLLMSGKTGDQAMAAILGTILGLGAAYLIALIISFPAYLWSCSLTTTTGGNTRVSIFLRRSVLCSIFPVLIVFPCLAGYLFR
jgi:hypothetical protein